MEMASIPRWSRFLLDALESDALVTELHAIGEHQAYVSIRADHHASYRLQSVRATSVSTCAGQFVVYADVDRNGVLDSAVDRQLVSAALGGVAATPTTYRDLLPGIGLRPRDDAGPDTGRVPSRERSRSSGPCR